MVDPARLSKDRCIQAGFKFGHTGPHNSRTMMLEEMSRCLDTLPPDAARSDYRTAIVERNILGKSTESTRKECFRRLRELYALEPTVPIFGIYRRLDATDAAARPILSMLVACARDPLLRSTMPVILGAADGSILGAAHFDDALEQAFPGCMKPKVRAATARHIASTWRQSGHLQGRTPKMRVPIVAQPASLVMALIMGALQDVQGASLFGTVWCRILDLNAVQAQALAAQAHREGLLNLRAVSAVVEITFPGFADAFNAGGIDEPL